VLYSLFRIPCICHCLAASVLLALREEKIFLDKQHESHLADSRDDSESARVAFVSIQSFPQIRRFGYSELSALRLKS